jgi:hypothetical protein
VVLAVVTAVVTVAVVGAAVTAACRGNMLWHCRGSTVAMRNGGGVY